MHPEKSVGSSISSSYFQCNAIYHIISVLIDNASSAVHMTFISDIIIFYSALSLQAEMSGKLCVEIFCSPDHLP